MDQVLFSEPSNKMKEKMELLRLEEERARLVAEEQRSTPINDNNDESTLSAEEKFFRERFPEKSSKD